MAKKPNILIIMVDQLAGTWFRDGMASFLHAPTLRRLYDEGVNFSSAYTASPLCAPSRASFMSGLLPHKTRVYDNAAEFTSSIATFAHYFRNLGYNTTLCGKMHFVGPDQLHGFEKRLTTDIYPADFGWTPDWTQPHQRIDWWYHNMGSVLNAGIAEISNQMEYDDEVAFLAKQKLYDIARKEDDKPFLLTVSFTHPHDPFLTRKKYWDLYKETHFPDLHVPSIGYEQMDPHSKRLYDANDTTHYNITTEHVNKSRHAYFANISYIDDMIGQILDVLKTCNLDDNTIILFTGDHGEMLGERGMWFKMNFFENSACVPLLFHAPNRFTGKEITHAVSATDIMPTLLQLATGQPADLCHDIDGISLFNAIEGDTSSLEKRVIYSQYCAEGSVDPMIMARTEQWKYIYCEVDPPQLFDLAHDPYECRNLAEDITYSNVKQNMQELVTNHLDIAQLRHDVLDSQARRLLIYKSLRNGAYYPWDYSPLQAAGERFMRNHMDLNVVEVNNRFPKNS